MITCQKDKFQIPENITYLNCSYMSPLPTEVEQAGLLGVSRKNQPWNIVANDFFDPVEEVKSLFAKLIYAKSPDQIAIIPSVSYGIANVVKNIYPNKGQNIVILEEQFPSNYYSWKKLSIDTGCELRVVSPPDSREKRAEKWNSDILDNIDSNTVAVAMPNNHWADGTLFDLYAIRAKTNQVGAYLIIDGTQSVGAMPFNVSEIQPDALICSSYKWLLGSYSFALAYYSERFNDGTPIEESWMNRLGSEDFQNLVKYQPLYKSGANKYCVGEFTNFVAMPMMKAALELLLTWTPESIQEYCYSISENAIEKLQEMGFWMEEPKYRSNHLIGLRFPEHISLETIKAKANHENVFVSFRGNAMRVSPHLFNTEEDFEKLLSLFI